MLLTLNLFFVFALMAENKVCREREIRVGPYLNLNLSVRRLREKVNFAMWNMTGGSIPTCKSTQRHANHDKKNGQNALRHAGSFFLVLRSTYGVISMGLTDFSWPFRFGQASFKATGDEGTAS
jgi:hypothetical protein